MHWSWWSFAAGAGVGTIVSLVALIGFQLLLAKAFEDG
jgi:hypothetical protein